MLSSTHHNGGMARRDALLRAVKTGAVVADRVRPSHRGIVVLAYHRVGGGTTSEIDLDPAQFADHLAYVAPRAVRLGEALDALDGAAPDGHDPIVVTFDDGTADVVEHAVPRLVEAKVPAVLYLATAFVDGTEDAPAGGRPVSWAALADAVATGFLEIGSHTHGHVLLDRIDPGAAAADLDRSIGLIEDRLGVHPLDFAYPKAMAPSASVDALVRARFRSAALAGTRPNRYGRTDPWRLARSPVQSSDADRWFRAKAEGGMALEGALRVLLNRRRYVGATT
jgi:peptidoglycan/xylan/chitin deacetylase (PgdA/CDA1 family)